MPTTDWHHLTSGEKAALVWGLRRFWTRPEPRPDRPLKTHSFGQSMGCALASRQDLVVSSLTFLGLRFLPFRRLPLHTIGCLRDLSPIYFPQEATTHRTFDCLRARRATPALPASSLVQQRLASYC